MNQKEVFIERKLALEDEIRRLEEALGAMPEGSIVCYQHRIGDKKYPQFYKLTDVDGKTKRKYLSEKDLPEARILAKKHYYRRMLLDLRNELKCINLYIKNRNDDDTSAIIAVGSPYRKLLDENLNNWEYMPYNKSTDHPEHLIVPGPKGEMVRSKSEAMIAQVLYSHAIPYRYEEIHDIYGYPIATDFTIMHPKTGKIILWEHFGRCDDPDYQKTIDFKMPRYIRAGYLPGVDMITTFEDSKRPLSYIEVEKLVQFYFL